METTLMDRLIKAGYLESDCFHWQSDLSINGVKPLASAMGIQAATR